MGFAAPRPQAVILPIYLRDSQGGRTIVLRPCTTLSSSG